MGGVGERPRGRFRRRRSLFAGVRATRSPPPSRRRRGYARWTRAPHGRGRSPAAWRVRDAVRVDAEVRGVRMRTRSTSRTASDVGVCENRRRGIEGVRPPRRGGRARRAAIRSRARQEASVGRRNACGVRRNETGSRDARGEATRARISSIYILVTHLAPSRSSRSRVTFSRQKDPHASGRGGGGQHLHLRRRLRRRRLAHRARRLGDVLRLGDRLHGPSPARHRGSTTLPPSPTCARGAPNLPR